MDFRELEEFGRVRLSRHFFMRDFLHSEIATRFKIANVPHDPQLAVEAGTRLCEEILEPIVSRFGSIHVRSGFRSAKLNEFGARLRLNCAGNERNRAYHIWDERDENGHMGAAACVVVPWLIDNAHGPEDWRVMAAFVHCNLPYHRLTFFRRNFAFNIGWHERPIREVRSYYPKREWLVRDGWLVGGVTEDDLEKWLACVP